MPDEIQPHFGANVARIRGQRGYTQRELADKVGVQRLAIINYESGKATPGFVRIRSLAEALGVEVDELLAEAEGDDAA